MSRCDLIVARYAKDVDGIESVQLAVVKGVAGATPISPPYTTGDIAAGDALHEMPLYRVTINGLNIGNVIPLFNTYPKSRRIRSGSVLPSYRD